MSDCPPGCRVNFNLFYLREKHGQTVVIRVDRLANIRIRIPKYGRHLYFNHRCKENYVLPSSLRFRPPLRSAKGSKSGFIVQKGKSSFIGIHMPN